MDRTVNTYPVICLGGIKHGMTVFITDAQKRFTAMKDCGSRLETTLYQRQEFQVRGDVRMFFVAADLRISDAEKLVVDWVFQDGKVIPCWKPFVNVPALRAPAGVGRF